MGAFGDISPGFVLYDANGNPIPALDGATHVLGTQHGIPVAGTDGTNLRFLRTDNTGQILISGTVNPGLPSTQYMLPSYYAVFDRITPAANKYIATLFNTSSTRIAVVQRVWTYNWQFAAVNGASVECYFSRITARTAGTAVTIRAADTSFSVSAGITADTNSTAVTEDHLIRRVLLATDDLDIKSQRVQDLLGYGDYALLWERKDIMRGLVLRQNQGVTFRQITSETIGSLSAVIEFTDEAAA